MSAVHAIELEYLEQMRKLVLLQQNRASVIEKLDHEIKGQRETVANAKFIMQQLKGGQP